MKDEDLLDMVGKCRSLEELSIASCEQISSQGLGKVLLSLTNLRKLDVAGVYKLDDDCFRDIAKMCPLLEDLDLWSTSVTRTGVSSVMELAPKLATLNLSQSSKIDDSEMDAIMNAKPPHVKITHYNHHDIYKLDSNSAYSQYSDGDENLFDDDDDYYYEDYNEDWNDEYDDLP
ncbi:hypothetical protein DFS34DRAFT_268007 [Phlyctochytrium arcticum]|nr:hypothetical protein DFS34DRAFT_689466 [Phlyctochytrium arcticum]KAI9093542.1 hypothetical protein DFS34DRAFT_268007 [Phlyctochytrium arcticum]